LLQGCGAIIAKQWCIEAHQKFKQFRVPVRQVAFVHDEIQIETEEKYGEQVAQIMCKSASQAGTTLGFRCPVDAESKIGLTWFDTH
jgi:DNA polymerase I-like protein with 3'-5' exonuclease and polymerase domains